MTARTNSNPKSEFRGLVRSLGRSLTHAEIAKELGLERWQLRNWIYRYKPNEWAAKELVPKLKELAKKQTNKNQK
jgi:hypothetical protein